MFIKIGNTIINVNHINKIDFSGHDKDQQDAFLTIDIYLSGVKHSFSYGEIPYPDGTVEEGHQILLGLLDLLKPVKL